MDDDYIASLLKNEAQASLSEAGQARALFGAASTRRPNPSARKPNLRFLNNIIRETDTHNSALKLRELEQAGDRLRRLHGDPPRREDDPSKRRRRTEQKLADGRRGERSRSRSPTQDRSGSPERSRARKHRGRDRRRSSSSSGCQNRERHGRGRDEDRTRRARERGDGRDEHHERDHERRMRKLREDDANVDGPSDESDCYRRKMARRKSRDHPRRRSYGDEGESHRERSGDAVDRYRDFGRDKKRYRSGREGHEAKSRRQESYSRSEVRSPPRRSEHRSSHYSRSKKTLERQPRSPPAPEPWNGLSETQSPTSANLPQPVVRRGRGAHSSSTSAMDARFLATYDPKTDVQPERGDEIGDDWDRGLEALRDRALWQKNQAERLRAAGFTDEEIEKWERGKKEDDVIWKTRGEGREWDRGKVLQEDGAVATNAEWITGLE